MNSPETHCPDGGGGAESDLQLMCRGHFRSFSARFSPNSYIITARSHISSCHSSKLYIIVPTMVRSYLFTTHVFENFRFIEISCNKVQFLLGDLMNHQLLVVVVLLVPVFPSSRFSGCFTQCVI